MAESREEVTDERHGASLPIRQNTVYRYLNVRKISPWQNDDNIAMFKENLRLATLTSWPSSNPLPSEMALRGFYFKGIEGIVHCAFCGKSFDGWKGIGGLVNRHAQESIHCTGIHGRESGNIPLYDISSMGWRVKSPTDETGPSTRPTLVRKHFYPLTTKAKPTIFGSEHTRAETFDHHGWPLQIPDKYEMARNGLILAEGGIVRCAFCTVKLENWNIESNPAFKHLKLSPTCPFLTNPSLCDNMPREGPNKISLQAEKLAKGVKEIIQKDHKNFRHLNEVREIIEGDTRDSNTVRYSQQMPPVLPANLHMSIATDRLTSFQRCGEIAMEPHKLVEGGFYYVGPEDLVRCYSCNGGLYGWMKNEDVWERHAGFYPECRHVNHHKSPEFIKEKIDKVTGCSDGLTSPKNQRIRAKTFTCRNCKGKADILFAKCGHISACTNCEDNLSVCPQCKERTNNRLQVFF
jgi:hypothetical protein